MFNLEQHLSEWRRQMLAAGVQAPEPLGELETHLREEIARQIQSGCNEADAFAVAVGQLGAAEAVRGEFDKVKTPREVLRWRFLEILFWSVTSMVPLGIGFSILRGETGGSADMSASQRMTGLAALVVFMVLAWGGRLGCQWLPVLRSKRARNVGSLASVLPVAIWWCVFLGIIAPQEERAVGQFLVAFVWAFVAPAGLMIGLVWGLEAAARRGGRLSANADK